MIKTKSIKCVKEGKMAMRHATAEKWKAQGEQIQRNSNIRTPNSMFK
jgi:hypothetical protein